jgi:hypothetical protein
MQIRPTYVISETSLFHAARTWNQEMSPTDRTSETLSEEFLRSITPTTPLRLEMAARIAFPDGSLKVPGLRKEIARGRLACEKIAGKIYTTLEDIQEMRRLCRVQAQAPHPSNSRRTWRLSEEEQAEAAHLSFSRFIQQTLEKKIQRP